MKTTAEHDMRLMITTATKRSKEDIRHVINSDKIAALKDTNDKYSALLENFTKYDTTKEDL